MRKSTLPRITSFPRFVTLAAKYASSLPSCNVCLNITCFKRQSFKAREATGISAEQLTMPAETLAELIRGYCRESGVRSLRKQIEKVFEIPVIFTPLYNPLNTAPYPPSN